MTPTQPMKRGWPRFIELLHQNPSYITMGIWFGIEVIIGFTFIARPEAMEMVYIQEKYNLSAGAIALFFWTFATVMIISYPFFRSTAALIPGLIPLIFFASVVSLAIIRSDTGSYARIIEVWTIVAAYFMSEWGARTVEILQERVRVLTTSGTVHE